MLGSMLAKEVSHVQEPALFLQLAFTTTFFAGVFDMALDFLSSISANGFTGILPLSVKKLTNLTDLRIRSNNFSGKIPDFIGSLTKLYNLHIQGFSMEGPIPSAISHLKNLDDLKITDLIGNTSTMSDLSGMENMRTLMLRKCFIRGNIPPYIGNLKSLRKQLDLSFDELSGEIPSTFLDLMNVDKINLEGNMLPGNIPS